MRAGLEKLSQDQPNHAVPGTLEPIVKACRVFRLGKEEPSLDQYAWYKHEDGETRRRGGNGSTGHKRNCASSHGQGEAADVHEAPELRGVLARDPVTGLPEDEVLFRVRPFHRADRTSSQTRRAVQGCGRHKAVIVRPRGHLPGPADAQEGT